MMPRGFKPVGWVAAVGGAALGCYMLSLNVAAERAELAKVERQIIAAKTEIRALHTELGTRGRLQQLEHWNAEVLALSAPTANQFVQNEVMLARFETRQPTIADQAKVQMASVTTRAPSAPAPAAKAPTPGKKLSPADYAAAADRAAAQPQPMLRLASAQGSEKPQVIKASVVKTPEPAKKAEVAKAEPKKLESKVETAKAEPKKAEPKKVETAKAEPKAEPKKAVTAKAEPKKAELKKGEAAKPTKSASADSKPAVASKAKAQGGAGGQ
jgi:hypothetical protein